VRVQRSLTLAGAALALVSLGACSTPPYTRAEAVRDLRDDTSLSDDEITCVLDAVEEYFAQEYVDKQREAGIDEVSKRQTRVYVKNALAAADEPSRAETEMFDEARARCTA
jgi:hypothetical protein